ncbi:hypothetical protein BN12_230033 [Nostocoides japonicum T1-X7]|uniref:Uncharacterized protein n=1 Tax=Nostocoides japonicum T1-X7 TaxID=1194083 RepID=A0A077LVX7_9MICO|nr:alpha/beta hydrolase [Tetrasphaera japonica]CCH77856.1 hypothetical protein BN12_230033 [Tetrasphaera japonica T1-X7]
MLERVGPEPDRVVRYAEGETGIYEVWEPRAGSAHDLSSSAGRAAADSPGRTDISSAGAGLSWSSGSPGHGKPTPADTGDVPPARAVTVALVHGGFWKAAYDRTHLRSLAGALARDGFHVASVEYPRVGMPGGGWPGTGDAVADALTAIVADPSLPSPVVAVGHSAGGHLVAWCASSPTTATAGITGTAGTAGITGVRARVDGLAGVVPLAGVLDLVLADRQSLGDQAVRALVGLPRRHESTPRDEAGAHGHESKGDPAADPADGIPVDADPARQRLVVPSVLVHGADDMNVPLSVSEAYLASRTSDDAACRLVAVGEADHFALIDPLTPAYTVVVEAIESLVPGG